MNYIEIKEETVQVKRMTCSHPLVTKIWEYGGGAANVPTGGGWNRFICLMLKDGTVKQFQDDGNGNAIKEAELFLQNESMVV